MGLGPFVQIYPTCVGTEYYTRYGNPPANAITIGPVANPVPYGAVIPRGDARTLWVEFRVPTTNVLNRYVEFWPVTTVGSQAAITPATLAGQSSPFFTYDGRTLNSVFAPSDLGITYYKAQIFGDYFASSRVPVTIPAIMSENEVIWILARWTENYGAGANPELQVSVSLSNDLGEIPVMPICCYSAGNASTALLGGGATFTGRGESLNFNPSITVGAYADVAGTLLVDWSSDENNWDFTDTVAVPVGGLCHTFMRRAHYYRVRYTNGGVAQAAFRLWTILNPESVAATTGAGAAAVNATIVSPVGAGPVATSVRVNEASIGTVAETSVAAANVNTALLAANLTRRGFTVRNDSTGVMYLALGGAASATSVTALIAGATYEDTMPHWAGTVNGFWAAGAVGNARIRELT